MGRITLLHIGPASVFRRMGRKVTHNKVQAWTGRYNIGRHQDYIQLPPYPIRTAFSADMPCGNDLFYSSSFDRFVPFLSSSFSFCK